MIVGRFAYLRDDHGDGLAEVRADRLLQDGRLGEAADEEQVVDARQVRVEQHLLDVLEPNEDTR